MGKRRHIFFLGALLVLISLTACATTRTEDLEERIISAYVQQCKTLEYKWKHGEVYIVDPTGNVTDRGCPTALIRGWRDGVLIKEKEVEVCECKERHRR
jgi:hypothetical protein